MEPFTIFTATAAPLDNDNIDTDQILPARFLMMPRDERYKTYVFRDLRIDGDEKNIEGFVLNKPAFRHAHILVAGRNFGCGSSREGAVFTLVDAGFRSIIAIGFGDIFYNNAINNGLLPVVLPEDEVLKLRARLREGPGNEMSVDLESQTVTGPDGAALPFDIDPHRRYRLLNGLDSIGYTLQFEAEIDAFEADYRARMSW